MSTSDNGIRPLTLAAQDLASATLWMVDAIETDRLTVDELRPVVEAFEEIRRPPPSGLWHTAQRLVVLRAPPMPFDAVTTALRISAPREVGLGSGRRA